MKESEIRRTHYRLAARLRGNKLELDPEVRFRLQQAAYERIRAIRRRGGNADRTAFDESIEWERLGDFLLAAGAKPGAARAWREAILSCLDGTQYDYGRESFPCRVLRLRFFAVLDKALACCGGDPLLRSLVCDEPLIRAEYARMRPETVG
ncbi:hypothetical protein [Alistipes sp.]|uniref:hypothetical protein n=1 Tax=Alistipes sp. TaxID=1872444 RepID=UPI003AF02039